MQLTFFENKFHIIGAASLSELSRYWESSSQNSFTTTNIKEAARFRKYADSKAENIFKKLALKTLPLPVGGLLSPIPLMPFQKDLGVPFILSRNRSYLAHEPGLGKSAQFITAVNSKPGKALVICPAFLKTNWAREITKWSYKDFPSIQILPETSKRFETNWAADYIIVSDSMLAKEWVQKGLSQRVSKFIAIDEAHRFKTPGASRTVALFGGQTKKVKSRGLIYKAEHVVALSGTPMLNRPLELWPILYAMAPQVIDFMNERDFSNRFCDFFYHPVTGLYVYANAKNEDELNKRIMGSFMQRIKKTDVLKDLPDKVRTIITIDEDPRSKEIKALDKKLLGDFTRTGRQAPESLGEYAMIRHETGLAKIKWVTNFVKFYLEEDEAEQVILFGHHRDVVDGLAKGLAEFSPLTINGGVPADVRTQYQDEFQSGKKRLIIGNIDSMNLGLTLTKATRVVFAEYAWTPALNEQAEDRAHRIGQKDSVFVNYLVLPNSLDEMILAKVQQKEETIEKVIG